MPESEQLRTRDGQHVALVFERLRTAILRGEIPAGRATSQVALANEVFTPTDAEVERAERILQAMEEAAKEGKGAVSLDGHLIDAASIRMAQNLMTKVEQMRAR